jgi:hypothetical protein
LKKGGDHGGSSQRGEVVAAVIPTLARMAVLWSPMVDRGVKGAGGAMISARLSVGKCARVKGGDGG